MGTDFEYDPLRSCMKWNPFTCYPAPKFLSSLLVRVPPSPSPLLVLEVRPFLGAASIALVNALSYSQRAGFVLSVDTWQTNEGFVGVKQTKEAYPAPKTCETEPLNQTGVCNEASYYQYLRNVATESVGGRPGSWVPPQRHTRENATKRLVSLPLLSSKAKGSAHWLGTKGLRPGLVCTPLAWHPAPLPDPPCPTCVLAPSGGRR